MFTVSLTSLIELQLYSLSWRIGTFRESLVEFWAKNPSPRIFGLASIGYMSPKKGFC